MNIHTWCRMRLKCDGTRAETRFRLSAKQTSAFKSAGASDQSTTGSRGVRPSGSNAGYTMFRGSVKSTGYPLHSPVSPSLPLQCVTVCHHISTGLYHCPCNVVAKWVPVTAAWCVLRPLIEERPPVWRVDANMLNKQLWAADKGWSSSLGVDEVLTTTRRKTWPCYESGTFASVLDWSFGTIWIKDKGYEIW
jgi:hypothetical protein